MNPAEREFIAAARTCRNDCRVNATDAIGRPNTYFFSVFFTGRKPTFLCVDWRLMTKQKTKYIRGVSIGHLALRISKTVHPAALMTCSMSGSGANPIARTAVFLAWWMV